MTKYEDGFLTKGERKWLLNFIKIASNSDNIPDNIQTKLYKMMPRTINTFRVLTVLDEDGIKTV